MAEEIELANVNANDSDSKASQETADKKWSDVWGFKSKDNTKSGTNCGG